MAEKSGEHPRFYEPCSLPVRCNPEKSLPVAQNCPPGLRGLCSGKNTKFLETVVRIWPHNATIEMEALKKGASGLVANLSGGLRREAQPAPTSDEEFFRCN